MKDIISKNYLKKSIVVFLCLLFIVFTINLIGNSLLYLLRHNGNTEKLANAILQPSGFAFVFIELLRDVLVVSVLTKIFSSFINKRIYFSELLYISIFAEFVFVAQSTFDLIWVYTHKNQLSFTQANDFQSFSIYSFIKNIPDYLFYAATTCNLWEVTYMLVLAVLLKTKLERSFTNTFGLVFLFYGLPLILWMVWVTFIEINRV